MKNKILLVPFPYGDGLESKKRPVLCLTDPIGKYEEIIVAYITTKIPYHKVESDIIITKDEKDFEKTGLLFTSAIRLHRLFTISSSDVIGEIGELSKGSRSDIQKKIATLFS